MIIASSISGLPIYAPSAAFAPTNSAEVSAIASAYQVVSSTATQPYAGTAYVTSINEAPVSAARAGNAANASLANSAWYDGTGRLISALPDSAAVSAIASSYAESAASPKQDTLTFGYDDEDKISSINGSALAGEGGGLVTAIGTSESGIASINNSGLVDTAALHSADYSSLYVQEPLYISASGDSSYIGISGNVDGVDSATCSAIASAYAESAASSKLDTTAASSFATTAYVDSSVSSKLDATASSQFLTAIPSDYATTAYVDSSISGFAYESAVSAWTAKQDALTYGYDTANNISSIDGSAIGGQGGIDSATCSSIASAYAESAVSSVSGNYYTTANESGYALSSDVSATVDLVSTQSANWGGSALALSAGPGISLTLSGNTLVASTDETVLWSDDNGAVTFTASEVITNFERIAVYVTDNPLSESIQRVEIPMAGGNLTAPKFSLVSQWDSSWRVLMWWVKLTSSDMKSFSISYAGYAGAGTNGTWSNGNEPNYFRFYKVVGINRTVGV